MFVTASDVEDRYIVGTRHRQRVRLRLLRIEPQLSMRVHPPHVHFRGHVYLQRLSIGPTNRQWTYTRLSVSVTTYDRRAFCVSMSSSALSCSLAGSRVSACLTSKIAEWTWPREE